HVLFVLKTARVAAMRGRNQPDRPAYAGARHRDKGVGEERMPVAHPDVDRQVRSALAQPSAQPLRLRFGELRQWRDAAEELVMMGNLLDALGCDASAAQ